MLRSVLLVVLAITLSCFVLQASFAKDDVSNRGLKIVYETGVRINHYSIKDLENLGVTSLTTSTPFTDGVQTFEGVSLKKLFAELGVDQANKIEFRALNNYATEIPYEHQDMNAILAYKMNGDYLKVRDYGPLWVVYPAEMQSGSNDDYPYRKKMIWQVSEIRIR